MRRWGSLCLCVSFGLLASGCPKGKTDYSQGKKAESLEESDVFYSVIDGLQRLYCFGIALLLVSRREELVVKGLIPKEAWEHFSESVTNAGEPRLATEELLKRMVRYVEATIKLCLVQEGYIEP